MKTYAVAALVAAGALCCVAAAPASAKTVWLCKPGQKNDPCTPSLTTTHITPTGKALHTTRVKRVARPKVDCFYVYPTVSDDRKPQADRSIDPEMRSIARYQAARYSRDCRVFAPPTARSRSRAWSTRRRSPRRCANRPMRTSARPGAST